MPTALVLLRCTLLLALVGSAVSLADDAFTGRPFCGFESGCDAVTQTVYGRPFGVPLSAVGLVGFGALFVLTLFPTARSFVLVAPLAVLAGIAGGGLIAVQAVGLTRFCPQCSFCDGCDAGHWARAWGTTAGPSWRFSGAAGAGVGVATLFDGKPEPPVRMRSARTG